MQLNFIINSVISIDVHNEKFKKERFKLKRKNPKCEQQVTLRYVKLN